jgi:hypothetical protein
MDESTRSFSAGDSPSSTDWSLGQNVDKIIRSRGGDSRKRQDVSAKPIVKTSPAHRSHEMVRHRSGSRWSGTAAAAS